MSDLHNPNIKNTSAEIVVPTSSETGQKHTVDADFFCMKKIVIKNKDVFIDDDDFELVSKHNWNINIGRSKFYVRSGKKIQLHHLISGFNKETDFCVKWIDGNQFNNTKSNLLIIPKSKYIERDTHYELVIHSFKHGMNVVYFDKDKIDIIQQHKWHIEDFGTRRYATSQTKDRKHLSMHRLVTDFKFKEVDHVDRNGLNNQCANLREATRSQNNMNKITQCNSTTGFKGVHFYKNRGNYQAYIWKNRKKINLGYFNTPVEAAMAYNDATVLYHGEFARLNYIPK